MSLNRCLIITSSYPFGDGEAFFSSELEQIAKAFSSVDIIPITARTAVQRELPRNANCLRPLLSSRLSDFRNLIADLPDAFKHYVDLKKANLSTRDQVNCIRLNAAALSRMRELSEITYDLIYLYWGFPSSAVLRTFCHLAPCVQRFHGSDLWGASGGSALCNGIEAYANHPSFIFVSSEMGRKLLLDSGYFDSNRLFVRYLGSEDLANCPRTPFSEGLSITSNAFISEGKRIDLIARTVKELSCRAPVRWTHIGGGSPAQIHRLRHLAGPYAKVSFEGTIQHSQLRDAFERAKPNLHLSLSRSEGLAINVLEAVSANIPVVCSDVGAMREVVTPNVGLLVDERLCNSPEELANVILNETRENGILERASPRTAWIDQFDAKTNAIKFARELKAIANGSF